MIASANDGARGDSAPDDSQGLASKPERPRRPRRDGLVYDIYELAWVLGRSVKHIRRIAWMLPRPIKPLGNRWARSAIEDWLARGGPVRK
jgi:hypothetical protein